jgi:energy-coupling factor transport system ATP-binding protein
MIRIENFWFAYETNWILKDISLTLEKGETLLITGKSGSGKSTLALAIAGFLRGKSQKRGKILFKGKNVDDYELFDLAQMIGVVQQDPENQICTLTVLDELGFALENMCLPREEIERRIRWALSIVGAEYLKDRDTFSLSGGEKQKIAIASILAMKPEVIIFDEPTSNLDPTVTKEIFTVIERIQKKTGITVIVIEHKWEYLLSRATKRGVMDEGRLRFVNELQPPQYEKIRRKRGKKILEVTDLRFSYNGKKIFDGVSFAGYENEVIGIMGKNGSGKTTLLMCLMNFLPYIGEITLYGESTEGKKTAEIAQTVGMIFQNPTHQLFESTVLHEAEFALKNFKKEGNVDNLLSKAQLEKYAAVSPFRLSYGEKRRLNIVSVLAYDPAVILLDEPFIGQDYQNVQRIMGMLLERKNLIIMILHNAAIAENYCTRILRLNNGVVEVER